jgi:hypothetical protein
MMGSRKATLILLCEDTQQECFARYFLQEWGWENRDIRAVPAPPGTNAEQYVREQFPKQLAEYRRLKCMGWNIRLVAIIDADTRDVKDRLDALEAKCREQNVEFRAANEQVAIAVPKRNIETWIRYVLANEPVDETVKYGKLRYESECKESVEAYACACYANALQSYPNSPASLLEACKEFQDRVL